MKKIIYFIIALTFLPIFSQAQDTNSKVREIGINLNGPSSFGIRYRSGNEQSLLRLTLLSINGENSNNKDSDGSIKRSSIGFGFNIGFEKRRSITNNLCFYYGSDLLNSYNRETYEYPSTNLFSDNSKYWTLSPGLGIILGFNYKINNDINISAEVVPSIWYSYSKATYGRDDGSQTKNTTTRFKYGLSSSAANLTLSFRLGK